MKVLVITSGNSESISPFISDQVQSLEKFRHEFKYFRIKGRGLSGYLRNYPLLIKEINEFKPDLIHAHYGLSGLFAGLQRRVPVITTFHGSDVNIFKYRLFSQLAMVLSAKNILVSKNMRKYAINKNFEVIPCGVDVEVFSPLDKSFARRKLDLKSDKKLILFSSSFTNKVKNFSLLKSACELLPFDDFQIIELKGYNRRQVSLLMNAVDVAVMTSFMEGSPQFIKEAMACNTPIVTTRVGDVAEIINDTKGCFISSYEPKDVALKIEEAIYFGPKTNGRNSIGHYDSIKVSKKINRIYDEINTK